MWTELWAVSPRHPGGADAVTGTHIGCTQKFLSRNTTGPDATPSPGLSMRLLESKRGLSFFAFEHSEEYQQTQHKFLAAVESMEPNNIVVRVSPREGPRPAHTLPTVTQGAPGLGPSLWSLRPEAPCPPGSSHLQYTPGSRGLRATAGCFRGLASSSKGCFGGVAEGKDGGPGAQRSRFPPQAWL